MGRGGKRPGAGRKPSGKRDRTIYVTDAEYTAVMRYLRRLRGQPEEEDHEKS